MTPREKHGAVRKRKNWTSNHMHIYHQQDHDGHSHPTSMADSAIEERDQTIHT